MHRYWVVLHGKDWFDSRGYAISTEYGITAASRESALGILNEALAKIGQSTPETAAITVVENVSVKGLDSKHVIPNMGNPSEEGIWFPLGYTQLVPWWKLGAAGRGALSAADKDELSGLITDGAKVRIKGAAFIGLAALLILCCGCAGRKMYTCEANVVLHTVQPSDGQRSKQGASTQETVRELTLDGFVRQVQSTDTVIRTAVILTQKGAWNNDALTAAELIHRSLRVQHGSISGQLDISITTTNSIMSRAIVDVLLEVCRSRLAEDERDRLEKQYTREAAKRYGSSKNEISELELRSEKAPLSDQDRERLQELRAYVESIESSPTGTSLWCPLEVIRIHDTSSDKRENRIDDKLTE